MKIERESIPPQKKGRRPIQYEGRRPCNGDAVPLHLTMRDAVPPQGTPSPDIQDDGTPSHNIFPNIYLPCMHKPTAILTLNNDNIKPYSHQFKHFFKSLANLQFTCMLVSCHALNEGVSAIPAFPLFLGTCEV